MRSCRNSPFRQAPDFLHLQDIDGVALAADRKGDQLRAFIVVQGRCEGLLSWRRLGGGWPPLSGLCVGAHGLAAGARQDCRPPSSAISCARIAPNLPQNVA